VYAPRVSIAWSHHVLERDDFCWLLILQRSSTCPRDRTQETCTHNLRPSDPREGCSSSKGGRARARGEMNGGHRLLLLECHGCLCVDIIGGAGDLHTSRFGAKLSLGFWGKLSSSKGWKDQRGSCFGASGMEPRGVHIKDPWITSRFGCHTLSNGPSASFLVRRRNRGSNLECSVEDHDAIELQAQCRLLL